MPETYRCFIALPLTEELHGELATLQRRLQYAYPEQAVRWVRPESMHLTLFFLGDVLETRIAGIKEALAVVARHVAPFSFSVGGLGAFPGISSPRVVWVGVQDPEERLALLHHAVNEAMHRTGFQPESRPFSPHLTLGRVNRRATRDQVNALRDVLSQTTVGHLGEAPVDSVLLMRSMLKSSGAEYTPLATFPLGR